MPDRLPNLPEGPLHTLLSQWASWPCSTRQHLRAGLAASLAEYVAQGGNPEQLDLECSYVQDSRIHLLPTASGTPLSNRQLQLRLPAMRSRLPQNWLQEEELQFLAQFRRALALTVPVGPHWTREVVERESRKRIETLGRLYQHELHTAAFHDRDGVTGVWLGETGASVESVLTEIRRCHEASPRYLNQGDDRGVFEAEIFGRNVVIKYYEVSARQWQYRWHRSRARRAWAGACTLTRAGIRCPHPLGFVEQVEGGLPRHSYFISSPLPDVVSARKWIKPHLHNQPAEERTRWRSGLQREIRRMYNQGLYHGDTKADNLLLSRSNRQPDCWWWVDLEDIQAGRRPPLWKVIRNMVQLNGSIGRKLSREERIAFLRGFRDRYPKLLSPRIHNLIERKTRVRLSRELRRICGP